MISAATTGGPRAAVTSGRAGTGARRSCIPRWLTVTLPTALRYARIGALALLCGGATPSHAGAANADAAYPVRQIRVIVPQAVGGTTDLLVRVVGEQLESALGVAVIVDARPGGNGIIGNDIVKRAAPDGYTLLAASTSTHVMTPHVVAVLSYDPLRDFEPVINLVEQTKVVLASTTLGVTTLPELVALARSRPGQLNYGSGTTGSASHLDTEQLEAVTGIELVQVPYRGSAQITAALIANEVQVVLASVTAAQPALASGRVRALAVLADRRSPLLPDVPTIAEAGLPRLDVRTWIGFLAPAGTPARIVDKLNRTLDGILARPDFRTWLDLQGMQPIGGSPAAFGAAIRDDYEKWGKVARGLGLRPQ